jgi:hypothetical protein
MSNISTENNMNLYIWDQPTDVFKYNQLADNFTKIAAHDHSTGKGVPIPANGIANNAITKLKTTSDVTYAWQSSTTALPSSPIDDQLLWTTVNSQYTTSGPTTTSYATSWFFHYALSQNQWRFAGGSPVSAGTALSDSIASTSTYTAIPNTDLTIPYKGIYKIDYVAQLSTNAVSGVSQVFLAAATASATTLSPSASVKVSPTGTEAAFETVSGSLIISVTSNSPQPTYQLYSKATSLTVSPTFSNAFLSITPIYITA